MTEPTLENDPETDCQVDPDPVIAELQDISRNLPAEAMALFVSTVFRIGDNLGERHENNRQGLLRDADYRHQEGGPWGFYSYSEWTNLLNRWSDFATDHLANRSEPPPVPTDDGNPNYRDRFGRLPTRWLPGDVPVLEEPTPQRPASRP